MAGAVPEKKRLDGWKEIGGYLGASVRTVQRWEVERALPVHHAGGGKGYSVFAFPSELDRWLSPADGAGQPSGTEPSRPTAAAGRFILSLPRWLVLVVAGLAAASLLAGLAALRIRSREIGSIAFSGQQLLASTDGKVIWSYDFGQPLYMGPEENIASRVQILDMNRDGRKEAVVAPPLLRYESDSHSSDGLYAFSSRGEILWKHDFNMSVRFGGEQAGPRWRIPTLLSTDQGGKRFFWAPLDSFPMSVSILVRVDAGGHAENNFINYGHINALGEINIAKAPYLLAGGINNECRCAALAVLWEPGPGGHSPQTGSLANCDRCPPGQPYRYFLFPRSEVNLAAGYAYNGVIGITSGGGRLQAMVYEIPSYSIETPADWSLYSFSDDLTPVAVTFSDHYLATHRRLSSQGKIGHKVENCPERLRPLSVRGWSPQDGWRSFSLPPVAR